MIGPSDIQIILGKVRPLSRPHPEAHPQVLIIALASAVLYFVCASWTYSNTNYEAFCG